MLVDSCYFTLREDYERNSLYIFMSATVMLGIARILTVMLFLSMLYIKK